MSNTINVFANIGNNYILTVVSEKDETLASTSAFHHNLSGIVDAMIEDFDVEKVKIIGSNLDFIKGIKEHLANKTYYTKTEYKTLLIP